MANGIRVCRNEPCDLRDGCRAGGWVGQDVRVNMRALSHTSTIPFRGKIAPL